MNSLIYNAGTVSVSGGSAIVEGNLTGWAVALVEGGVFSCDGLSIPILSVEDDTHLTLAYAWPGAAGSGKQYAIARTPSEATARAATWTVDRLGKLAQTPWGVGVVPDGRGTLAQRNALNPMPNDDYCWLRVEVDEPLEYYFREGGVWLGPYELRGENSTEPGPPGQPGEGFDPAGAWSVSTLYSKNDLVSFGPRSFVSRVDGNVGHEPPSSDADDTWWQFVPAAVGPANVLSIGTVSEGPADAEITGTSPSQELNLTIPRGLPGLNGADGWTPVFAVVADGARYVQQVVDWVGGTGTKPATGQYVGPDGFVPAIGDAVNIRGASGAGTGDVVGPAGSVDGEMALFDGVTGKLVKGGGAPFSGAYGDLSGRPTFGTAAAADASDFATAAQGAKADAAVQPSRTISAGSGLSGGGSLEADREIGLSAVSIASLSKADTAVQPGDLGSAAGADISDFATAAQGSKADISLRYVGALGASEDLDTFTAPGIYTQNQNAGASGGANYPVALAGMLEVLDGGASTNVRTVQRYTSRANPSRTYHRMQNGAGTWYAWAELASSGDIPDISTKVTKANDTGLGGFTATSKALPTSGTINLAPTDGNIQHCAKTGAVTMNAPTAAGVYTIIVEVHNTNAMGTVTLAGFTKADGDAFTATSGDKFHVHIAKTNSAVTATVKALQ